MNLAAIPVARGADPAPGPDRIAGVSVDLAVGGTRHLRLDLGSDGRIRRAGRRRPETFSGIAPPDLFEDLRRKITPELLRWAGQSWSDPAPRGEDCRLEIGFRTVAGRETLLSWKYGSESQEPPPEILDFVLAAAVATGPWYGEQVDTRSRRPVRAEWHLVS